MKIESITQWLNKPQDAQEGMKFIVSSNEEGIKYLDKKGALHREGFWSSDKWLHANRGRNPYVYSFRLLVTYDKT